MAGLLPASAEKLAYDAAVHYLNTARLLLGEPQRRAGMYLTVLCAVSYLWDRRRRYLAGD